MKNDNSVMATGLLHQLGEGLHGQSLGLWGATLPFKYVQNGSLGEKVSLPLG